MTTFQVTGKNGAAHRLLVASITEPASGAWVADVETDAATAPEPPITIRMGGETFVGTVVRGGLANGRWVARIVGGAGGLSIDVPSNHESGTVARDELARIMAASGEALDGAIDSAILGHALGRWTRPAGPPSRALDDIANEIGCTWRVLRNGKIWLGRERWPTVKEVHVEITRNAQAGTVTIAPEQSPSIRPAVTYLGKRVSLVNTTLTAGKLRQEVWGDEGRGDRTLASLARLIDRLVRPRIDYLAMYPATVVWQRPDGSLDVKVNDERLADGPMTRIPIRYGTPGVTARVPKGASVLIGFESGDPRRAYASLWRDSSVDQLTIAGGTQANARQGDMVMIPLSPANIVQLAACFLPAAVGVPPTPLPSIVAAAAIPGSPMPSPPGNIIAYGVISSGSAKVKN